MPVMMCRKEGKPGLRWGKRGVCYTYTAGDVPSKRRAEQKAQQQGRAIKAQLNKEKRNVRRTD